MSKSEREVVVKKRRYANIQTGALCGNPTLCSKVVMQYVKTANVVMQYVETATGKGRHKALEETLIKTFTNIRERTSFGLHILRRPYSTTFIASQNFAELRRRRIRNYTPSRKFRAALGKVRGRARPHMPARQK